MININNIPLVTVGSEQYANFFAIDGWGNEFYVKPITEYLPDFTDMDEKAKERYKLKNIKPEIYLVGMEIISDKWLNKGICGSLFKTFGLILDEAYPMAMKSNKWDIETIMYFIRLEHIYCDAIYNDTKNGPHLIIQ